MFASLGVAALPAGKITQIRLITDENGPNYVTTPDGVQHPLMVPSDNGTCSTDTTTIL